MAGQKEIAKRLEDFYSSVDIEDDYQEMLDETGTVEIGGLTYTPSDVLLEIDPTAYRVGLADYEGTRDDLVEVNGDYYTQEDYDEVENEIDDEIYELEEKQGELEDLQTDLQDELEENTDDEEIEKLKEKIDDLQDEIEEIIQELNTLKE